jgi:tetratricopeptide (TPR) repeat protein
VANPWDTRNTRWETLFDQAVTLADARRLSDTLSMLKRIRSWQHRQTRYGRENHDWHDAELLWLQGVVLERARQPSKADPVWLRLAQVYQVIARSGESAFLPRCARCAERVLGFAPSWFSVATQLRDRAGDVPAIAASFRRLAHATDNSGATDKAVESVDVKPVEASMKGTSKSTNPPSSSVSKAKLKAKREVIRKTYRELEQPATVIELCEQYLKLESQDGVVWAWYGHTLIELGRYTDAAAALQTARGLVTTEDIRGFVLQCQGDLEYAQGHYPQAEAFYREAVGCEGMGDWPLILLGRVLFRLGAVDEAEQCFRQAVSANGTHPATALYELGRILRARSALFESRRALKQAIALESHDDIRECLADVERLIRLQSPPGGKPKALTPRAD